MADKKFDLVFNASLEVGQVKTAVASLTKSLENAGAKIPQSMATNLNRMIQSLNTELNKLEGMTDIQLDPKNAKNVGKSYEKIFTTFQQIKAALGDINRTAGLEPEKFFPSEIVENINKATSAIAKYKKAMEAGFKSDEYSKATKELADAEKNLKSLRGKQDDAARKAQTAALKKSSFESRRKDLQDAKDTADAEHKTAQQAQADIQAQIKAQEELAKKKTALADKIAQKEKEQQKAVNKAARANEIINTREAMKDQRPKHGMDTDEYRNAQVAFANSSAEVTRLQQEIDELKASMASLGEVSVASAEEQQAAQQRVTDAFNEVNEAQKRLNANQKDIDKEQTNFDAATADVKALATSISQAEAEVRRLTQVKQQLETNFDQSTFDALIKELEKLGIVLPDTERDLEGIERALESLKREAAAGVTKAMKDMGEAADDVNDPLQRMGKEAHNTEELGIAARHAEQDMENLKWQVLDFFSITNAIQLFKRAVTDAFDTVKELDATMTEAAVVTEFSVGDMWDKLPTYAAEAKKLGTTINDLYSATTLYYQQGLNSQQAMTVGAETMKMARIANMEAAEATQAMTAALRGFNMEINEVSATRINDVYSELAAITAADTSQIATAMTKTASIAASANMEFETTAALLAQIIETTQEAPETAGTAMKTIIARFTEVKELFDEGMLTGKDDEGEEININKIDAALKTVGISLKDFLTGSKGIDDIFLELASKWDTLDLATQRYIATTAAGSRQQSRFIAMMSNYDRTMQLVNAANTSAGASSRQFEKTMDSMDAKLNNLTNAWDQFVMGLANQEALKAAIDGLTGLLNAINGIIDAVSGGNGGIKSIMTLLTTVSAIGAGSKIFNKVFEGTKTQEKSKEFFEQIRKNLGGDRALGKNEKSGDFLLYGMSNVLHGKTWGGIKYQDKIFKKQLSRNEEAFEKNFDKILPKDRQVEFGYRERDEKGNYKLDTYWEEINIKNEESRKKLQDLFTKYKNKEISEEDFRAQGKDLGINEEALDDALQKTTLNINSTTQALTVAGNAAMITGGAFGALSAVLRNNGMEEAANGLDKIAMGLTTVGGLLNVVSMGMQVFSKGAILSVLGPMLAVAAAIAAVVFAFKQIQATSPEGKLKAAQQATEQAAEAADRAAEAYNNLAAALDGLAGKEAALENLTVGTTEWKNAVQELNGEVLDLVEQYPELAQFIDSSDGYLRLDMEGSRKIDGEQKTVKDILSDYQENKFKAQSASAAAKLQKQQAQQNVDYNNLNNKAKVFQELKGKEKLQKEYETAQQYYASLGIAAIGPSTADTALARQRVQTTSAAMAQAEETGLGVYGFSKEATDELARAIATGEYNDINDSQRETLNSIKAAYEAGDTELWDSLKEYGQGLIAADAATKVFTDSLLSNALVVAEVSDEQKANMMNFMSPEQIDNLVKDKKEEIAKEGISDEEKNQYAETMGYEYINGKFYVGKGADQKEVAVSDDSITAQLAGIQAQDDLTGRMEALDSALGKIDENAEGLPSTFKRMTEKGEGAALTLEDVQKAQAALGEEGQAKLNALYNNEDFGLSNVYETYDEFIEFIQNSTKLAEAQHTAANKKLNTIGMADYTKYMNFDIGQTKNVSDLLYESVVQSGQSEGKKLAENLKAGLEEEGEGKKLAEALGMIDLDNIDSIKKLNEYLEELNYAGKAINIDRLEQQIIEATNASKKFSLDNLKEELKSVQDLIKDIKGREETDRIYSEEDYKKLIESGKLSASDFVMQGIDEYVYIGETNEQLISALQENTTALLGETQEKLREAAEKSQTWDELKQGKDTEYQYDLLGEIATGKKTVGEVSPDLLIKAMGAVGLSTEEISQDMLDDTGGIVGNIAQIIKDRITSAWNQYGSATAISGNLNALEVWGERSLPQIYYSQMSGQEILNAQGTYQAEGQDALDVEEDQAARIAALEAKLAQIEGGTTEADATFKDLWGDGDNKALAAFQNNVEAAIEYNKAVKAAVVDSTKLEQKMSSLADTIKDSTDALKEGKKGGDKYQKALDKVAAEAEAVFGENYTKEFVEENLPLFLDWADGVEGSTEKIRDAMLNSTEASFKNIGELRKNIAALDGTQLNIYGYANMSEANGQLYGTQQAAEEAAADINALGMYQATVVSLGTRMENGVEVPNGWDVVVSNAGGNVAESRGGGGGGGGGGSEWKNPYDKLYNTQENIDRTIREREQIERRYQRLLDRRLTTAQELYKTSQAEIDALREQAEYQQKMLTGRQEMLQEEMDKNKDLQKYATADIESGQITIDWDLINSVKDEEEGKKIEEYISKLEELRDSMHESQDAIEEINDSIWEIEDRGREEYMDLEERIKEAITENRQREIDTLEEINDSINEANEKLLDSIQSSIDKIRQDRENEKTEEELGEKQRRLAYLEQDTSGANALEILALQEEIRQGQEDYTDSLIDQKISELQEQNDKAAEQREKQITIMQNQLDWYIESGRIWAEVDELLKDGLNPQGGLIRGSKLEEVMKNGENWTGLSKIGQMDWLTDLETLIAQSMNWQITKGQLENLHDKLTGQTITFRNANGKMVSGKIDEEGKVWTDDQTYYKDVYQWIDGGYYTTEQSGTKKPTPVVSTPSSSNNEAQNNNYNPPKVNGYESSVLGQTFRASTYNDAYTYASNAVNRWVSSQKAAQKERWEAGEGGHSQSYLESRYAEIDQQGTNYKNSITVSAYKTGGLADFTGPAWLDGTKSRPELVLNQRDTQNFIQLKDILSSIMSRNFSNTQTSTENNGDITYDIDINVETIGSDYDVEQVANKVKSMINENARYRNNNAISLKR